MTTPANFVTSHSDQLTVWPQKQQVEQTVACATAEAIGRPVKFPSSSPSQASPKPFPFLLVRRMCRADRVVTPAAPDNIRGIELRLVSRGAFDSAELREKTKITKPSGISQNSMSSEHKHRITRWNAHPLGRLPCRYEPPEPYRVNMIGASKLGWCLRLVHLLLWAVWSHALTSAPLKAFMSLVEYHRPQRWRCLPKFLVQPYRPFFLCAAESPIHNSSS